MIIIARHDHGAGLGSLRVAYVGWRGSSGMKIDGMVVNLYHRLRLTGQYRVVATRNDGTQQGTAFIIEGDRQKVVVLSWPAGATE